MQASVIIACVTAAPDAPLVERYLATLDDASPSTRRQRAWALAELLTHAATLPGAGLPGVLSSARILDTVVPDARVFA